MKQIWCILYVITSRRKTVAKRNTFYPHFREKYPSCVSNELDGYIKDDFAVYTLMLNQIHILLDDDEKQRMLRSFDF